MKIGFFMGFEMRLSWPQHLAVSRTLELSAECGRGQALALIGVSLLILAEDLVVGEHAVSESRIED